MKTFAAQQMPDGQWRLTKNGVDMGIFKDRFDVDAAVQRIVNPVVVHYDEKGEPIA